MDREPGHTRVRDAVAVGCRRRWRWPRRRSPPWAAPGRGCCGAWPGRRRRRARSPAWSSPGAPRRRAPRPVDLVGGRRRVLARRPARVGRLRGRWASGRSPTSPTSGGGRSRRSWSAGCCARGTARVRAGGRARRGGAADRRRDGADLRRAVGRRRRPPRCRRSRRMAALVYPGALRVGRGGDAAGHARRVAAARPRAGRAARARSASSRRPRPSSLGARSCSRGAYVAARPPIGPAVGRSGCSRIAAGGCSSPRAGARRPTPTHDDLGAARRRAARAPSFVLLVAALVRAGFGAAAARRAARCSPPAC